MENNLAFRGCLLAAIAAFVLFNVTVTAVEVPHPTDPTYDKDCIVNTSLPDTAEDNYYDCQGDEKKEAGTTDCCLRDKKVGCCVPEGALGRMAQIGIGMACGTVFLMTVVFIWNWCDVQTFPFLKKWKACCRNCCPKKCLMCPCLREEQEEINFVKVKIQPGEGGVIDETPEVPSYETPEELKKDVKEDFFG